MKLALSPTHADKDFLSTVGTEPGLAVSIAAGGSGTWPSANQAIMTRCKSKRAISVALLNWIAGTQSGNYDIGLYDSAGTRLWSKGSTAVPAGGIVAESFTAVPIPANTLFYVAMAFDNTTASLKALTYASVEIGKTLAGVPASVSVAASFPLPATITPGSTAATRLPLVTIREA